MLLLLLLLLLLVLVLLLEVVVRGWVPEGLGIRAAKLVQRSLLCVVDVVAAELLQCPSSGRPGCCGWRCCRGSIQLLQDLCVLSLQTGMGCCQHTVLLLQALVQLLQIM
jgi:hypothetical protein